MKKIKNNTHYISSTVTYEQTGHCLWCTTNV